MKKKIVILLIAILGINIGVSEVRASVLVEKTNGFDSFKLTESKEKATKKIKKKTNKKTTKNKKKKAKKAKKNQKTKEEKSNFRKIQNYNKDTKAERDKNTKTDGSYIVGTDILAGEYVVIIGDKDLENREGYFMGSMSVYSDSSETTEVGRVSIGFDKKALSTDGLFSKAKFKESELTIFDSKLVELKEGQLVKIDNVKIQPAELREKPNLDKIVEGYYKVGRDIPTGKYKVTEQNQANETLHSIWIYNTVDPSVDVNESTIKIYQDYSDETYPDEIKLEDGTYVYFSDLIFAIK